MISDRPGIWHVHYQRSAGYDIESCPDLLDPGNEALLSVGRRENARRFIVVDENVHRLHASAIRQYFDAHEIEARLVSFPGGEQRKTMDGYLSLLIQLDSFPIDRRDEPIIAIGGGVLTDLVGFLAATYRRGLPHIKVPTTLMGYVDASVGVKAGVNFNCHKNRLGAFAPPEKVLLDRAFLTTLPRRHLLNGTCEIVKLAVIADAPLFAMLERDGAHCIASAFQDEAGAEILDRSVQRMVIELQDNLFEDCLSRAMDFGHTFSYGLELGQASDWLHGEAVLMDILLSVVLAGQRGLLSASEVERVFKLVNTLGIVLPSADVDPRVLWQSVHERTLHRDGFQRIPLPSGLGSCTFVNDVCAAEVDAACQEALSLYGA